MSYGIIRVQKFQIGSVKGIEIHDCRKKDGVSNTNQNIDWNRTGQNYDLHFDHNLNFAKAIKEKISRLKLSKAVRKDAVVMAQVLVTSDNGFFKQLDEEQRDSFFRDSYDFLANRYGSENVISATVHLDEKTPHLHFNFVPVTSDGRLSAKALLTKQSLIEQQTAFYEQVGKKYGLRRGLQGGKKKHLEMCDLKAATALQEALKTEQDIKSLEDEKKALEDEIKALEGRLDFLKERYEQLSPIERYCSGVDTDIDF